MILCWVLVFLQQIWITTGSKGEVLQMNFPSITVAAQEKGNLTAESGLNEDIHINPGNSSGTVYFEGIDLLEIVKIVYSLPPIWINHSHVGFVGTYEGGKEVDIPLKVKEPSGGRIRFSLVAGDFPPGIHLESDRSRIYGIAPDVDAQYSFTIRATGSRGRFEDAVFKMETIELQHCQYEPCHNGALCNETNVGKGYECVCADFYGGKDCNTDCRQSEVGISLPSKIPDAQLSAYLSHEMSNATEARLDSEEKGWCGENANSWLQVDLGNRSKIAGVTMFGYSTQYLTESFQLSVSTDGQHFQFIKNGTSPIVFPGRSGRLYSSLQDVTTARFVRFHPYSYNAKYVPCMKVELYGCVL
ncbi:Hypothetical predicted protein [Mytilus galloprovincialis]|uniref:Uncharacterized protein n=2 Tax=Mytilus galloprovincialis TaxID=29158 RepID=A0A8B6BMY0_MYTGA|nr:Hypothetical predicted protein [Mytilus galloprovincialis]